MYRKILVPIDLAHVDKLEKAINTAYDLSKHYKIPLCFVGVSASAPGKLGHTPEEYAEKLDAYAASEGARHGIETSAKAYISHDPTSDLDATLMAAIDEVGADLVVMATHIPNVVDYIWPSNGGKIAQHATASVFLIR
ncbi:MAG: universal stress protein UspA [Hyphomicrobiales bacterium]|nr:MAG: universal stress protein UspA [Hyphomicrobiales bacterium]